MTARRARLLRFIENYGDPYREYTLRLGRLVIKHDRLTDDALEDLCADMVRDFWLHRKIQRENRAVYARNALRDAA